MAGQEELPSARLTRDKALIALGQLDAAIEGLEKTLEDGKVIRETRSQKPMFSSNLDQTFV